MNLHCSSLKFTSQDEISKFQVSLTADWWTWKLVTENSKRFWETSKGQKKNTDCCVRIAFVVSKWDINSSQTTYKPGIQRYQFSSKIKKKTKNQLAGISNTATSQLKLRPASRTTEKKLKCVEVIKQCSKSKKIITDVTGVYAIHAVSFYYDY